MIKNLMAQLQQSVKGRISGDTANRSAKERNLDEIIALRLPVNSGFLERRAIAQTIGGMFSDFSMAVMDMLASVQSERNVNGSILEFGVYKGRSAALLGWHLRANERLVLCDVAEYLDEAATESFKDKVDFILSPTENFREAFANYNASKGKLRLIHIDASHQYQATLNELAMADDLLSRDGVIAMDDFTNLNYSQNIAAIFKYIYTTKTDLRLFLVTGEKGYLCRKSALPFYSAFILDRSIAELRSRGIENPCLARTDKDEEYSAFYIDPSSPTEGLIYGREIYKNYFITP